MAEALLTGRYAAVRQMEEGDAPSVAEWRNRPDASRFLYQWEPARPEGQLRWFRKVRDEGELLFMFDTPDGEPVGTACVYGFDRKMADAAEWGRLVAARVPGHPRALIEACYLVHRICFEVLGMRRLVTTMTTENKTSNRMNRFLGYVQEGVRRRHWQHPDGFFEDLIELGLFPEEFAAQRPSIEKLLYGDDPPPAIDADRTARIRAALGRG